MFDFKRAFYKSSNTYFIHYGMNVGLRKILSVAKRFHLGEKTQIGLPEKAGFVPNPDESALAELQHSLADVSIGQEVTTTPLQIAGMVSVIANGGTLYWPRVVDKVRAPDSDTFEQVTPPGRVRDHVQINPQHLALIRQAMVMDTETHNSDTDKGSAYDKFHDPHSGAPLLGSFRVAGKTGSAEVKGGEHMPYKTTWFVSYGPYENPRYAVVVMVDHGSFGGISCAPVAVKIYQALIKMEQATPQKAPTHGMVADIK
jgi:penicillin-binding protein 2